MLSACSTTDSSGSKALTIAKTAFDGICAIEPGIYQTLVSLKKNSKGVTAAHDVITVACIQGPPSNYVIALGQLTQEYAIIQAALHPS